MLALSHYGLSRSHLCRQHDAAEEKKGCEGIYGREGCSRRLLEFCSLESDFFIKKAEKAESMSEKAETKAIDLCYRYRIADFPDHSRKGACVREGGL